MQVKFVSAAVGIIVNKNCVLMLKREKEPFANLWSLPGGKIESNEYVSAAVLREIKEEVGVDCSIDAYLGTISELVYSEDIEQLLSDERDA